MKRRSLNLLAAAVLLASSGAALAQDKSTLKILVGFPPGGSVDVVARLIADHMRSTLDQSVIIDNKPGAAGRVALGEVRRAAPDGNTLVLAPSGALVILPWATKNLGYDPMKDFTPVARVTTFDFAVTAGPAAPAGDLKGVLAETLEHHKAGKVRIVAVTGENRSAALPDVPTVRESGVDFVADAFFGLYGPANMPPARVQKTSDAVGKALASPEVQGKIRALALTPAYAGPQALATTQATHLKRWEAPVKASGYSLDQ